VPMLIEGLDDSLLSEGIVAARADARHEASLVECITLRGFQGGNGGEDGVGALCARHFFSRRESFG